MEALKLFLFLLTCCLELLFKPPVHAHLAPGDLQSRLDHVLLGTSLLPGYRQGQIIRLMGRLVVGAKTCKD